MGVRRSVQKLRRYAFLGRRFVLFQLNKLRSNHNTGEDDAFTSALERSLEALRDEEAMREESRSVCVRVCVCVRARGLFDPLRSTFCSTFFV